MKTTITITLEIECASAACAHRAVNKVLDRGDFQNAVEEYAVDNAEDHTEIETPLTITSTIVT